MSSLVLYLICYESGFIDDRSRIMFTNIFFYISNKIYYCVGRFTILKLLYLLFWDFIFWLYESNDIRANNVNNFWNAYLHNFNTLYLPRHLKDIIYTPVIKTHKKGKRVLSRWWDLSITFILRMCWELFIGQFRSKIYNPSLATIRKIFKRKCIYCRL